METLPRAGRKGAVTVATNMAGRGTDIILGGNPETMSVSTPNFCRSSSRSLAWRLRQQIKTDLGLDPIWSVAPNKLVAKVATRLVKPDGEYIVAPGEEALKIKREIREKLRGLPDDERDGAVGVAEVYDTAEIYKGPYVAEAPDLFVGFTILNPSPIQPASSLRRGGD